MKHIVRGLLAGSCATLLLFASIGSPIALGQSPASTTARTAATDSSPFTLISTRAGQRYGTGTAAHARTFQARNGRNGLSRHASAAGHAGTLPGAAPALIPPPPAMATQTTAPDNHLAGFAGLAASDQASPTAEPANSTVAVGPDEIVQMANLAMRKTNRAGTPVGPQQTVPQFFIVPTGFFDREPRIIYDSLHGRFVATEVTWDCTTGDPGDPASFGHGYIDLAVSRSTDPNGQWDLYFWGYNDLLPLDPSLGTSADKLAIANNLSAMTHGDGGLSDGSCGDLSSLTSYAGDILIASWADAIGHKASTLPEDEFGTGPPAAVFGIRAAIQAPATSSTLYVVGRQITVDLLDGRQPDDVIATAFTGLPTKTNHVVVAGDSDLTADGIVAKFANPPAPHQPGSPSTIVSAVDGFAQDALWRAGELSWATTYPCTPSGDISTRDCVRVTQVTTPSATVEPAASQDFLIGVNGFDSYMPGIGVSGDGTLEIVYSQSNTTGSNYASSYQQYQRPIDGANHVSPPVKLATGSGPYPGTEWGTYVGLGQDPQVASAVWQANESSVGAGYWSTFVDQLGTTAGTTFVPIVPIRVVDSRDGSGASGLAGKFVSSVARTFTVAGLAPIPATAVAVTGNVTVTHQTSAGYVAVTPTAQDNPSSSTLNFPLGDTRANNVSVPLSSLGTLSMTFVTRAAGKTTDLIFDVTGYFMPDTSGATYHPITPARLINSVSGTGQPGGMPVRFQAGVPQTFTIGDDVTVPIAATAISGNLTVTRQTKAGFLAVTPDQTSMPQASNLNFPLNDDRANGFTAQLNSSHQLSILYGGPAGATTDVILDVTGFYKPDLTGLRFFPLNPGRILDSRVGAADSGLTGLFSASVPRSLASTGHWAIPTGAQALTGNLTVVNQTTRGYAAITPDPDPNPATSTINFPLGDIRANGATVALNGSGSLALVYKSTNSLARTNLILDVSGYFQ